MDPFKISVKTVRLVINNQFGSKEPFQIVTITASTVLLTVWLYNFIFQDDSIPERAKKAFFRWVKLIPAVKREIDFELNKVRNSLEDDVKERTKNSKYITVLPESGLDKSQIIEIVNDNLKYEELVANRWKNKEDKHRREIKKYPRLRSGDEAHSSWPLFKIISFLKDQMVPAEQMDNSCVDTDDSDEHEENDELLDVIKKRICDLRDDLFLEVEKKKLELLYQTFEPPKELESEELSFFKSLIPHMEKLEPIRKLRLRIKIQQVIVDEMEAIPTHLPHSTSLFNTVDHKQFYD